MVIESLVKLYEVLLSQGKVSEPGYVDKSVGWEIGLDLQGNPVSVTSVKVDVSKPSAKKPKLKPKTMSLPDLGEKRTSGVFSMFLCDKSDFVFGVKALDDITVVDELSGESVVQHQYQYFPEKFQVLVDLHHEVLDDVDVPEVKALLQFLDAYDVESFAGSMFEACLNRSVSPDALTKDTFLFVVNGVYLHKLPEVRDAWQRYCEKRNSDAVIGQCMITGELAPIARTHAVVKGVRDSHSAGAGLSTFNLASVCSYGKTQNLNAPMSTRTVFAYTTALNYLLSHKEYCVATKSLTFVCWSESMNKGYAALSMASLFAKNDTYDVNDCMDVVKSLAKGLPVADLDVQPDERFYVLGLSPNASRLVIRFFYQSSFGDFFKNVQVHYDRLSIVGEKYPLTLVRLLGALIRPDESPFEDVVPGLYDDLLESVLFGYVYPVGLLSTVLRRISLSDGMAWQQAAIVKAYLLRNMDVKSGKECLTMGLCQESDNVAYTCGRLFAVYEYLQYAAVKVNTLYANYFATAAVNPAIVFPNLARLSSKHLSKLSDGGHIHFSRLIGDLKSKIDVSGYPTYMDLQEQGLFDLGYYHQKQELYKKPNVVEEDKENECN